MTMHALDLNYRSQGSRCLLGVGWIIINYIYIYILLYIIIYIHILKAWSRVSFWSGVPKWCCSSNAFDVLFKKAWFIQVVMLFSSFPIQSIICNARPFDVPCSFWSCCTWWPEHRCGGGDQTESWTDTCPGWLECSVNKQLLLSGLKAFLCAGCGCHGDD